MTATLTLPLPPGATEPFAAPEPVACPWCDGSCVEPDEENGLILCLLCDGTGVQPVAFELPPTRAYGLRRVSYFPAAEASGNANRLLIETATKPTHKTAKSRYTVMELLSEMGGRGWVVSKVGTDRFHCVHVGAEGVRCDCEASTYLTTAKHNQRAHMAGEAVYPGFGCVHADALSALLRGGWFDL